MDEQLTNISDDTAGYLIRLTISIGISFLIGLERSFSNQEKKEEEQFAGIRTFTLMGVFGFLSALLTRFTGVWLLGVSFAGMMAFVIVSYYRRAATTNSIGSTTEFACILTFLLGALVYYNLILLALVMTVALLLLLTYKPTLHQFVEKLSKKELLAIIQFVIISALVIPFLPDERFGPYDIWNLKDIWKMVILVSGISLVGYLIAKLVGDKGTIVAGMVGGLVSSTAVTLMFSKRSKKSSKNGDLFSAIAIISACTIMFPRVLVQVFIINRQLAEQLWIPIAATTLAGMGAALYLYKHHQEKNEEGSLPLQNPLQFSTAIKFALFYAGVMLLVQYSTANFGDKGTYLAGLLSGIADLNAITLSMAKMAKSQSASAVAINTIMLASLSNTLVKFLIVLVVGNRNLLKSVSVGFVAIFLTGAGFFLYYLFL
jgi:uncharacterized membrane protein (DUF4010 family)